MPQRKQIFLLDLPNELLYEIAHYVKNPKDLLMTCHRFYSIVYPHFPESFSANCTSPTLMLHYAITARVNETTFRRLFTHITEPLTFYDPPDHPDKILATVDNIDEITARVMARPTTIRLERHIPPSYREHHVGTALMHAIYTKNVKMVKHFTEVLNPAAMFRSRNLDVPFDTAVSRFETDKTDTDNIAILKILFKTVHIKYYVSCRGHFCTPLFWAVLHNFEDEVGALASRKASFNDTELYGGLTPLTMAISANNDKMAKLLIKLNPKSFLEQTQCAVAVARKNGNGSLARYMIAESLRLAGVDRVYGWSALHMAVKDKDEGLVGELLGKGVDVDAQDNNGRTPLHLAVNDEEVSNAIVILLIKNGAKVSAKDYRGKTPLHLATRQFSLSVVRTLLHAGADVNAKDRHGNGPLEIAQKLMYMDPEHYQDISSILIYGGAIPSRDGHYVSFFNRGYSMIQEQAVGSPRTAIDYM
jgi:ankyrin repeat protein